MAKTFDKRTKEEMRVIGKRGAEQRKLNKIAATMFSTLLGKELAGEPPIFFRKKYAHLYRRPQEKLTMKDLIIRAWIDTAMEGNMMAVNKLIEVDNIGKGDVVATKTAFENGLEVIKSIFGEHSDGI
jgi:hypothetical protein